MVRIGLKNNLHNFDRLDEGDGGVNQSRQMNQIFLRPKSNNDFFV